MRYQLKGTIVVSEDIEFDNRWNDRISGLTVFAAIFLGIQPFIV